MLVTDLHVLHRRLNYIPGWLCWERAFGWSVICLYPVGSYLLFWGWDSKFGSASQFLLFRWTSPYVYGSESLLVQYDWYQPRSWFKKLNLKYSVIPFIKGLFRNCRSFRLSHSRVSSVFLNSSSHATTFLLGIPFHMYVVYQRFRRLTVDIFLAERIISLSMV